MRLVYDAGRFDGADIDRMLAAYLRAARADGGGAAEPASASSSLAGPEEQRRLLALGRRRASAHGIAGRCRSWWRKAPPPIPERLALEQAGSDAKLTYGELAAQADSLARHLAARGVRRGDRVVVALERSPALVVALLAVGKAGAAYLPVDPAYPAERIHFLVEDAGARLALTQEKLKGKFPQGLELLHLDAWLTAPRVALFQDHPSRDQRRLETRSFPTVIPAEAGTQSPSGSGGGEGTEPGLRRGDDRAFVRQRPAEAIRYIFRRG